MSIFTKKGINKFGRKVKHTVEKVGKGITSKKAGRVVKSVGKGIGKAVTRVEKDVGGVLKGVQKTAEIPLKATSSALGSLTSPLGLIVLGVGGIILLQSLNK